MKERAVCGGANAGNVAKVGGHRSRTEIPSLQPPSDSTRRFRNGEEIRVSQAEQGRARRAGRRGPSRTGGHVIGKRQRGGTSEPRSRVERAFGQLHCSCERTADGTD